MIKREYFHITLEMLPIEQEIFPFHLHVYNPTSEQYSLYLHGNSPLTKEKASFLKYIVQKGAIPAVLISQKRTFLLACGLTESDVPDLAKPTMHTLQTERNLILQELDDNPPPPLHFSEDINIAIKENNFLPLINRVRNEVLTFKVTISHTVSLARFLCQQLLNSDNEINRTVTLTYLFAKQNSMEAEEILSDIVCAAFIHHTGITQLDRSTILKPSFDLFDQEKKDFQKHPGLTQHLVRKCNLDLSSNCINTILEHHERYGGAGYPNQKMGHSITPAALIIGVISHIIEYSNGRVNGNKTQLDTVLKKIKNNSIDTGLEFDFGDTIDKNIENLVNFTELKVKVAA